MSRRYRILIGVDLGEAGAAVLAESDRGLPPKLISVFSWRRWREAELRRLLLDWIGYYPSVVLGYEKPFAMPRRAKIANSQFRKALWLEKLCGKAGIETIEVPPQGAGNVDKAIVLFRLPSGTFPGTMEGPGKEHVRDACSILVAMEGEMVAQRLERAKAASRK